MAGWTRINEDGEEETGMYTHPFMVRGTPKLPCRPDETVASFATLMEAERWLLHWEDEYKKSEHGFASMHIENWNE